MNKWSGITILNENLVDCRKSKESTVKKLMIVSMLLLSQANLSYADGLQCSSIFAPEVTENFIKFNQHINNNINIIYANFKKAEINLINSRTNIKFNQNLDGIVRVHNNLFYQLVKISIYEKTTSMTEKEKIILNTMSSQIKQILYSLDVKDEAIFNYAKSYADIILTPYKKEKFSFGFLKEELDLVTESSEEASNATFGFLRNELEKNWYGNLNTPDKISEKSDNKLPTIGFIQPNPAKKVSTYKLKSIGFIQDAKIVDVSYRNHIAFDVDTFSFINASTRQRIGF